VSASPQARLLLNSCCPDSRVVFDAIPLKCSAVRKVTGLPTEPQEGKAAVEAQEPEAVSSNLTNITYNLAAFWGRRWCWKRIKVMKQVPFNF
jgi:hypothetical protein